MNAGVCAGGGGDTEEMLGSDWGGHVLEIKRLGRRYLEWMREGWVWGG